MSRADVFQTTVTRRSVLKSAGAATLMLAGGEVLVACGGGTEQAPGAGPVKLLRLSGGQWGYPSPFAYVRGPGLVFALFVFDTLIWKDSTGKFIPWLASSWKGTSDGLTWTFTIHPKAKWHDGTPVTADDAAFSFRYFKALPPQETGIVGALPFLTDASADGDKVTIRLNTPYAPFEEYVGGRIPIIPRKVWEGVTSPSRLRGERAVMGSGPYKLASWDQAQGTYRFTANSDFHLGQPVVRELQFVPSSNDLLTLQSGGLDGGGPNLEQGLPKATIDGFTNKGNYAVLRGYGGWTRALFFNADRGFPYDQAAFRQAVAYAVDRKALVQRILYGQGVPGSLGTLSPDNPWLAPGLPSYDHDLSKAAALLDSIGLKTAAGGVRTKPDGSALTVGLTTSSQFSAETAQLVVSDLRAAGLDTRLNSLDGPAADAASGAGNYDLALVGYGGLIGDPDNMRTQLSPRFKSASFTRVHGYRNQRFADLADQQLHTADSAQRRQLILDMQKLVAADVPLLQLYVPYGLFIYRKDRFRAWYFTPGGVFGGYPGTLNKQAFVTGRTTGP